MYSRRESHAYAQVDLHSQVTGASPHQLIAMLFDGAHNAILRANIYFKTGNISKRGEMISKAINIIDNGLRASLDHQRGGDIAQEMEMLYEYMSRTLLECNMRNDPGQLQLVDRLLMNLAKTWKEIAP
ncbi:flagellar protein potentiates polymerization [Enterobacter cancerogenus]|uniref:flagellar export chaperone FliS n=1 Tax=Enterobacter cancerogenus TaxID=69218 RepID=UPI001925BBB8|nr:flagellar export chaperone FliS [Enterobacter cancerogenus]CAD5358438.1 flagellar protein potentiates polymerization [Enterobacter cancerogenus]